MNVSPSYCRARLDMIRDLISRIERKSDSRGNDIGLLRNGFIPDHLDGERLIRESLKKRMKDETQLTFSELTRFNTWFTLHPEKICGREQVTTSLEFPIKVIGSREEIIQTITGETIMSVLEIEALATEVELQLLRI